MAASLWCSSAACPPWSQPTALTVLVGTPDVCPEQVNGFGEELIQSAWYVWTLIKCEELNDQFMDSLETAVLRV